ncbi:MAG: hypothetical protein AAGD38_03325 [Acidobacteriota bacterium]
MSTEPLDRAIRDHYESQQPSPAMLERLRSATATAERGRRRPWRLLAAAAMVLATLSVVWWQLDRSGFSPPAPTTVVADSEELTQRVVAEVVKNHFKDVGLDFTTGSYDQLATAMTGLNFQVATPNTERMGALDLQGGRYCSLQGHIAAQLWLEDSAGRRATLYQTLVDPMLDELDGQEVEQDGVLVSFWVEDEVFFARALTGAHL